MTAPTFQLVPQEAPRGSGPWQVSRDGGSTWWGITRDAGRRMILGAKLPLDRVEDVERGGVIVLDESGLTVIRRRPTRHEVDLDRRQASLFA